MKKIVLMVLGLFWVAISYSQQLNPMVDEFTYKPIKVTKITKDSTALSGAMTTSPGTFPISQES